MSEAKANDEALDDPILFEGIEDEAEREARLALLRYLVDQGVSLESLLAAAREHRLTTLPVEIALRSEPAHTLTDVARRSRVDSGYLREVLLSLGHPNPRHGERAFTDDDLEVAETLRRFLDAGLSRDDALAISRVVGHGMDRIAAVIREVAGAALMRPGDSEHTLGLRYAAAAEELVPLLGSVLNHELRVHVREQATSDVITRAELAQGRLEGTREVAVCFADLSHFTQLGERLSPEEIAGVGSTMVRLATEVARPPVELIKTIGDGAMLVSTEVPPLLDATMQLAERAAAEQETFPPMRAGLAYGPAVARAADWFGPPVNRASRIVDLARAGTVLAEEDVKSRAEEGYGWSKRRLPKGLKGISGRVRLYRLHTPLDGK
ncbi:MAG TPA: adenylate cyclase regulatory domain-containing protein [Solirubrobacteraceae bacterium]